MTRCSWTPPGPLRDRGRARKGLRADGGDEHEQPGEDSDDEDEEGGVRSLLHGIARHSVFVIF